MPLEWMEHSTNLHILKKTITSKHCSTLLLQEMQQFWKESFWLTSTAGHEQPTSLHNKKFYVLKREQWCASCVKTHTSTSTVCFAEELFLRDVMKERGCFEEIQGITLAASREQWILSKRKICYPTCHISGESFPCASYLPAKCAALKRNVLLWTVQPFLEFTMLLQNWRHSFHKVGGSQREHCLPDT